MVSEGRVAMRKAAARPFTARLASRARKLCRASRTRRAAATCARADERAPRLRTHWPRAVKSCRYNAHCVRSGTSDLLRARVPALLRHGRDRAPPYATDMKNEAASTRSPQREARLGVGHLNVELRRALHDILALARGDVVRDLGRELAVLHHQKLEILHVADDEAVEAVRHAVARLLVGARTDGGQCDVALELAAHARIDTAGFAPALLDALEDVRLVPLDLVGPL
eukprot:CAMPEP_0179940004 /NCGR_PEP_ID=MMETSP0983-20121128/16037_1 /TAXON_ID=483367 /ORGANISM="non described non described, Strain CCMP 2436" /LENGTH=226 /DNA_ID=CAMNT_0021846581 /DNA_START=147 /DNA_END=828 /DNA_ORIENTATION=-